jgi:hypothetical protein
MTTFAKRTTTAAHRLPAALALCLLAAAAAAQTTVSFTPDNGQFQCDEIWTIDVLVDAGATDLRGCSLVVEYDSDVIRPLSVTAGSLVTGAACPSFLHWFGPAVADTVAVDVANLGCSVSGPGAVVRITFEGHAGGVTPITLRSGLLRTGLNAPIPFVATAAQVQFDCAVGNERAAWGALKSMFR